MEVPSPAESLLSWRDFLCCPLTGQRLRDARDEGESRALARVEETRRAGRFECVAAREGRLQLDLDRPVEALLVREDGAVGYAVQGGIPVLLPDHALELGGGSRDGDGERAAG